MRIRTGAAAAAAAAARRCCVLPNQRKIYKVAVNARGACGASAASTMKPLEKKEVKQPRVVAPSFQDAIFRLEQFWSSVAGCTVCLPHSTEVGAGTMNPATFLRVLGPEPWRVCYAEPSHRPDDSRYGVNPNRVQRHTQFQVILKPAPINPQEIFLGSLEAMGIDTSRHDIRFVEDNWESPVLGAWGLGWEVWLDGMEVTQFTYFQQSGGLPCDPVAVEITYGLERILMALQSVSHFRDIQYSDTMTYGELMLQNEQEMSTYNLDVADVAAQRKRFDLYETEANSMLEKRLPIPAYDHVLKASHAFNVMDARGAVGVTERQKLFARMRALTRKVSLLWIERREELGLPLLEASTDESVDSRKGGTTDATTATATSSDEEASHDGRASHADFVLEIGSEELPADYVTDGVRALSEAFPSMLEKLNLAHGGVAVEGTPRRLVVRIKALITRQPDRSDRIRGPPLKAAFDADGAPTKAAEGFARKNGIADATALLVEDGYVWATVDTVGRNSVDVLGPALAGVISSIRWKKSMRWQQGDALWPRPLRWLLAVHGDEHVHFQALDVRSAASTRTMRRRRRTADDAQNALLDVAPIASVSAYDGLIRAEDIILDEAERRNTIWTQAQDLVGQVAGADAAIPAVFAAKGGLLDEVANLVESPTPLVGSFDEDFLKLPREVLETVMKKHQRYFPVADAAGAGNLKPMFVTVANGSCDAATVIAGNEAVLRARYEDARFFYESDLETPLVDLRPKLEGTMFQEKLGTMLDKANRTERLVTRVMDIMGVDDARCRDTVHSAAPLMYADLATMMVMEFTGLAGIMGKHYALVQGGNAEMCDAIFEAVLPRQAGDALPATLPGSLLSIASRLDSLVGLFAAGCAPTASADPYGLRRVAYGLVETTINSGLDVDLGECMALAAAEQSIDVTDAALKDASVFVQKRLEQLLIERDYDIELVRAVLAEQASRPAAAMRSVEELSALLSSETLKELIAVIARSVRIIRSRKDDAPALGNDIDESLFEQDEERRLWTAVCEVEASVRSTQSASEIVQHCHTLVAPINAFFDNVFVMSENDNVKANRFALLNRVSGVLKGVVDLSYLPGF